MQEPSKPCPRCNTQNYEGAMFCYSCSFKFPDAEHQTDRTRRGATFLGGLVIILTLLGLGVYWILTSRPESPQTAGAAPTPPTQANTSDYEKVVYNELGKMTIKAVGGSVTSVRLDAFTDDQKLKLRAMLVHLEVSDLTAQRACSLTLTYGGWSDKGDIRNCSGDRIGTLNSDAVGFMRDKLNEALQRGK